MNIFIGIMCKTKILYLILFIGKKVLMNRHKWRDFKKYLEEKNPQKHSKFPKTSKHYQNF